MTDAASVIDLATGAISTVGVGHNPYGVAISPDGHTAYVSDQGAVSMLRTMELIAGIGPMTQFDASAMPMFNSFTDHPNFAPYNVIKPSDAILTQVNSANAPLATQIATQSFGREDLANEALLNEAVWRSVKGAGSAMPAPQHHVIAPSAGNSGG
jgi:hypothetical protein